MSHLVHGRPMGSKVAVQGLRVIRSMKLWLAQGSGGGGSQAHNKNFFN